MKTLSTRPSSLRIVFLGLSLRSSWGNGHATTYRSLLSGLSQLGHSITFLERDVPWYQNNADWIQDPTIDFDLYLDLADLRSRHGTAIRDADAVILGSYVPQGSEIGKWVMGSARGKRIFYDIDTPITLETLARKECDYLSYELMTAYDLYLSFTGGPVLTELVSQYRVKSAHALYCSADPSLYYSEKQTLKWNLGYMGTYSADREEALQRLLIEPARHIPSQRFVVAGAMYPPIDWPSNITRCDHVSPPQHRAFYCSLGFSLNLTRKAMKAAGFSPSVRLFEAAACGCAIASDYWNGLETFFTPNEEIAVVESTADLLRLLGCSGPIDRRKLGERARERVLAAHSGLVRARELERFIDEL